MITFGFSTSNSIASGIMRWFTKSKASHAWIAFDSSELGIRMIMHATIGGFKLNQWNKWKKNKIIVAEFECLEDLSDGLKIMASQLDNHYDYLEVIMLAFKRWFKKFKNPIQDKTRLSCSEALTLLLQTHNFALDMDPSSTTPEDLLNFCENNKTFQKK